MNPGYRIEVFWSDEDEVWIASVPDLPMCSAHGLVPMMLSPRSSKPSRHGWTQRVPRDGQSRDRPAEPSWREPCWGWAAGGVSASACSACTVELQQQGGRTE